MKFLKYIFIAILFTFIGYENPSLTENPKKYVKFYLKKLGLSKTFTTNKNYLEEISKNKDLNNSINPEIVKGNSFDLNYKKILNFDDKTASFYIKFKDNKPNFEIFLQEGIKIEDKNVQEMNLPLDISFEKNGGVKSVFKKNNINFAIISSKKISNCYYASIYNLEIKENIFETECLPDYKNVDFNGLGGAFINYNNNLVLSIGAPEWSSEAIRNLAQKKDSLYGKTVIIHDKFFNSNKDKFLKKEDIKIFTKGHKNPQGITLIDKKIFSVEHGPQGGDELNLLKKGNNYGWPIVSYGTLYNNGKSFLKKNNTSDPIFTFLPSIAPSSVGNCPSNLKNYYKDNHCIIILSLRGMSLFVGLVDKKDLRLVSLEKFLINQRLRHFGLNFDNTIFQRNNIFYISVDNEGVYEIEFKNFR